MTRYTSVIAGLLLGLSLPAAAQNTTSDEIAKYRELLKEGNPGELFEMRGEALFKEARGPKNASLETCDFGLGPGKLDGAYAQLPRYFKDTGKVQDLESRLLTCMTTLQGFSVEEATANVFSRPGKNSPFESLVAFIAAKSNGMPIKVAVKHAKEKEMYAVGEKLFYRRSGPLDFSCATCHAEQDKRIRLQELPNIQSKPQIQATMASWPTYRVSQGTVRTMQHRLWDCLGQMRFPDIGFTSDVTIALHTYLSVNANGGVINVPSIKR